MICVKVNDVMKLHLERWRSDVYCGMQGGLITTSTILHIFGHVLLVNTYSNNPDMFVSLGEKDAIAKR